MSVEIREYAPNQFEQLHEVFLEAFSDYFVGFKPSLSQFDLRIHSKLHLNNSLSAIAWDQKKPVGFILHTLNTYQEKRTAYNGGTGVVPSYRQQGIAASVYQWLIPGIKAAGAQRILLEMVDRNTAAGNLYESIGFRFTRVFKCFRLKKELDPLSSVQIREVSGWNPVFDKHFSFLPSFLDSPSQIRYNLLNEVILEAWWEGELAGHLIFQPQIGRISQLAVNPLHRSRGIGRTLLAHCQLRSEIKRLTLMNIPEDQIETIEALQSLGFENELNQFELELNL